MELNDNQLKAIKHNYGSLIVVAGAGTGKTRVITERIKYLIQEKDIKPKEILALTFTDKAAGEMIDRIGDVMPLGYEEPWVNTFHSFCDRILKLEGLEIGIDPSYKILSYPDQWLMLRKNLFKFKLKYFRPLGNPTKFISAILKFISRLQDENISVEEFKDYVKKFNGDEKEKEKERWEELLHVYEEYEKLKLEKSKMDFGDLITWTLKLFNERPNILKKYKEQFKHVLVDEFQDTNIAQYELIKLLCPNNNLENRSLLVVGDDSQSIYKFRGAAVSNILQFKKDYPKADLITLIENYRSSQEILDCAYNVIQNNNPDTLESKLNISKKLLSKIEGRDKNKNKEINPQIAFLKDLEDEVEYVVSKIYEILALEPEYTYKDFAILARANNHLEVFLLALRKHGIPYQLVGNRGLYDRDEIRDILSLLNVLISPKDSISLYRALNIDSLGISYEEIASLLSEARYKKVDLWDVVSNSKNNGVVNLLKILREHQEKITKNPPHEFIYNLVNSINYLDLFLKEETIENQLCINNLNIFLNRVKKFEIDYFDNTKQIPTIIDLVDYLDLMIEAGENPAQAEIEDVDTVNLMTVHASKGLEFSVVFVVNTTSDRFPTRNRKDIIQIPDELIRETLPSGDEHIQEERRLFYVALTRAKKYLYITLAKDYGGKRDKIPSGFLNETNLEIQEIVDIKREESNQQGLFGIDSGYRNIKVVQPHTYVPDSLSFSKINSYETCPLQYKYQFILNIPRLPSAALSFGTTIHETLHIYHQKKSLGKEISLDDLLGIYENSWNPLGFLDSEHRQEMFTYGKELLKKYYEKHNKENIKHLGLEEWFNIKIGSSKFIGKIDRIDKLEDGVEIIDYKTGSVPTQKEVDNDSQVTFYQIGACEALGYDVKKLSYYYLEEDKKISTIRTQRDMEEKKKEVIAIVNKMKEGNFESKSGLHCNWCDYRNICPFAYKG